MVKVFFAHTDYLSNSSGWEKCLKQLPVFLQKKILQYKKLQDQQLYVLSRLLLKKLLEASIGSFAFEQLRYTGTGRPFLPGNIDFNLSHSSSIAVCAISSNSIVGIDVERIAPRKLVDFKNFFMANEWESIQSADDPLSFFYTLWTKKEALYKTGVFKNDFRPEEINILEGKGLLHANRLQLHNIFLSEGYQCTLCCNENEKIRIVKINPCAV